MRLSVDKWILTTVKKNTLNETTSTETAQTTPLLRGREEEEENAITKSDLIIEQQVTVEQSLYQEEEQSSREELLLDTTSSDTAVEIEIKHESFLDDDKQAERPSVRKLVSSIESNLAKSNLDKSIMSSPKQLTTTSNTAVNTSSKSQLNLNTMDRFKIFESPTDHNYYTAEFTTSPQSALNNHSLGEEDEEGGGGGGGDEEDKIITITTTTTRFTSSWQSLIEHLNKCLDVFSMRDVITLIEELIKLENYINNEINSNEKDIYFSSQQKLVENLNDSLKVKLFSLSQSSQLFNELKKKLITLLEARLSPFALAESLVKFGRLEQDYFNLLESIKSKVKLKIARYEKNLTTWNEFDHTCTKLNVLFEKSNYSYDQSSSLEYRGQLIDINTNLNKLKEYLSQLASICDENKYFELKNKIILYELKFKKLKEKSDDYLLRAHQASSDTRLNRSLSTMHSNSKQFKSEDVLTPRSFRFAEQSVPLSSSARSSKVYCSNCITTKQFDSNDDEVYSSKQTCATPPHLVKRKQTSDKSTFTVSEISTQTDQVVSESAALDLKPTNSSKQIDQTNKPLESDGKKLLLEAYLRNNNDNRCSSSSSCSRPKPQANTKCETITTTTLTTTTTRESGIGTYNEDEVESLQSANPTGDDYYLNDFNTFKQRLNSTKEVQNNEDYLTDQSNEDKLSKKYFSNKKYRKKLNRKIISSSSSSSVISSSLATRSHTTQPSTSSSLLLVPQQTKTITAKSANTTKLLSDLVEPKPKPSTSSESASTASYLFNLFKKICTLLIFLFPLVFLLVVYFFYIFFLNPSCCDLKRNYLFINIS